MKKRNIQLLVLMMFLTSLGVGGILALPVTSTSDENVPGAIGMWTSRASVNALRGQIVDIKITSTRPVNVTIDMDNDELTFMVNNSFSYRYVVKEETSVGVSISSLQIEVDVMVKIRRYGFPQSAFEMALTTGILLLLIHFALKDDETTQASEKLVRAEKRSRVSVILETAKIMESSLLVYGLMVSVAILVFDPIYTGMHFGYRWDLTPPDSIRLLAILEDMISKFALFVIFGLPALLAMDMIDVFRGNQHYERRLVISFQERVVARTLVLSEFIYLPISIVFLTRFFVTGEVDQVSLLALFVFLLTSFVFLTIMVILYELFPMVEVRMLLFITIFYFSMNYEQGFFLLYGIHLPSWFEFVGDDVPPVHSIVGTISLHTAIWAVLMLALSRESVFVRIERIRQWLADWKYSLKTSLRTRSR